MNSSSLQNERPDHETIARWAHELWDHAGRPDGRADEFWLRAERALSLEQPVLEPDSPASNGVPYSGVGASDMASLTDRELEIFELIGRGVRTREIAAQLGRSIKTIETHRARIMEKLHVKSAAELVSRAARWLATGL